MARVKQRNKFDFLLAIILLCIFISSVIAISASFPLLASYLDGESLLFKQIQFYILGVIIICILMYLTNENLFQLAKIGYKIMLVLLIYLFIDLIFIQKLFPGHHLPLVSSVNGATSWLSIPVLGSIQPSEYMKIFLIIICAYVIIEHNENKVDDSFECDFELFKKILYWAGLPLILILLQPDTGIFMIISFSLLIMLCCSGIRREWIIYGSSLFIIAVISFFYIYFEHPKLFTAIFGSGYKVRRFYGWLEPEKYKNGDGLQLYSALLSLGSAGVDGHGFRADPISIPEAHTDFIFAVIGLNFGFIGTCVTILLCLALDVRLAIIAYRNKSNIEKIMIIGFLAMLIIQQFENIGMVIGYFPITGVTLPLISYGGSSILSYMIAFGIIFNASTNTELHISKM